MTCTLSVNLKQCTCLARAQYQRIDLQRPHFENCSGTPVLIPCPIPPTVTMTVRLGECDCLADDHLSHRQDCAARPIRITCSISGKTWAESEVTGDCEIFRDAQRPGTWLLPSDVPRLLAACRERWALVKALAMGDTSMVAFAIVPPLKSKELISQRDAVFVALCEMARAEEAARNAQVALLRTMALGSTTFAAHEPDPARRPSAAFLAAYMSYLIEQVGEPA